MTKVADNIGSNGMESNFDVEEDPPVLFSPRSIGLWCLDAQMFNARPRLLGMRFVDSVDAARRLFISASLRRVSRAVLFIGLREIVWWGSCCYPRIQVFCRQTYTPESGRKGTNNRAMRTVEKFRALLFAMGMMDWSLDLALWKP